MWDWAGLHMDGGFERAGDYNYAVLFLSRALKVRHKNPTSGHDSNRFARFRSIYLRFIGTDINGVYRSLHKLWNPEKKPTYRCVECGS